MMKVLLRVIQYFFLCVISIGLLQCNKEKDLDLCISSPDAEEWFKSDAYHLSIQTMFEDSTSIYHSFRDSIRIPEELNSKILGALSAVYDTYPGPERDTVIDFYKVHTFPYYVEGEFIMKVITSEEWVQEFINGEEITSNDYLKEVFEEYNIKFDYLSSQINSTSTIIASVDSTLNLIALNADGGVLDNVDGLLYSLPNYIGRIFGNNMDLSIEFVADTTKMKFTSFHGLHWRFGVDEECTPFFIGH